MASRADAEELTQQAFERALRAWDRFDPRRASQTTWLLAIARNLLIDHYRAAGAQAPSVPLHDVDPGELPSAEARPQVGIDPALASALGALSDREREILALRYGGELTGPEIAQLMDLSLANVQQITSRALRRLRSALDRESVSRRRSGS